MTMANRGARERRACLNDHHTDRPGPGAQHLALSRQLVSLVEGGAAHTLSYTPIARALRINSVLRLSSNATEGFFRARKRLTRLRACSSEHRPGPES